MTYSINLSGKTIGTSNLENIDESMGVVSGIFEPTPQYDSVKNVFKLFTDQKEEEYYKKRDALNLKLHDRNGNIISTECIHIEDYSSIYIGEPLLIEIILNNIESWVKTNGT